MRKKEKREKNGKKNEKTKKGKKEKKCHVIKTKILLLGPLSTKIGQL